VPQGAQAATRGAGGETIQYTKTTIDPAGNVVHVKDKIGGGVVVP
jgi:hypothetical protein